MTEYRDQRFNDERALFRSENISVVGCSFDVGESALKHSQGVNLSGSEFLWKYPLWYCRRLEIDDCIFSEHARAGLWYTDDIVMRGSVYVGQKGFRRCRGVDLKNVSFPKGAETLWECTDITMRNVSVCGDYLCMNSSDIDIDGLTLDGCYSFDGVKNVHIRNSSITGRDAFWNSEDVTAENCTISGAYIGWNSKRLTFINCTIESLQGFCYIEDLKLVNCRLPNTTLAFEFSTVDADIVGTVDSVLNPSGGVIRADGIGELTLDSSETDPERTTIEIKSK